MQNFNERIIEEFRANAGRVGGPFEGMPMLLLHHRGARTGTERVNPLAPVLGRRVERERLVVEGPRREQRTRSRERE